MLNQQGPGPSFSTLHLGLRLLLFLGGKFRAAVDRDVHLGHDLTNPLLHGHTLICRKESFQHQESILLELLELREAQAGHEKEAGLTVALLRAEPKAGEEEGQEG